MMPEFRLKNYQQSALEKLRDYFKACEWRTKTGGKTFKIKPGDQSRQFI
jgi:hypothetical protein